MSHVLQAKNIQSAGTSTAIHDEPVLLARQAIVDAKLGVRGYALVDRARGADSQVNGPDFLLHALSKEGSEAIADQLTLFVRCGHEFLADKHLELLSPQRVVLEIALPSAMDASRIVLAERWLAQARARGFQLAFDHQVLATAWRSWARHASFVRMDFDKLPVGLVKPLLDEARRLPHAEIIAGNVETELQHRAAVEHGVQLFRGNWFARPVAVRNQPIRPSHLNILELINHLRGDGDLDAIEVLLKRDPVLSLNLLRFVNAAANGFSREITSFRQAVMLLGQQKLLRWAALLLAAAGNGGSPALARVAAARGRFMETLAAQARPDEVHDEAFIVGIFSLLDVITSQPMEKVLGSLNLSAAVKQALLERSGPHAQFLSLVESCESANDAMFAKAITALGLDGSQVNLAHLHALAWAESMMR